jgi:serine/threonine-protein kinase ATR
VIVAELEAVSDLNAPLNRSFQAVLPSSGSISEFWPESQHSVALSHELQKTISSQTGVIYVAYNLLFSMVRGAHGSQVQGTETAAFEHQQPWILDTCHALWKHFQRWTTGSGKRLFHDEAVGSYLQVLAAIAVSMKVSRNPPSGSAKAAQSLVRGVSSLLEKTNLSAVNQVQLAALLVHLRAALGEVAQTTPARIHQRANSSFTIVESLETNVARLCHDADKFSGLERDLKVCFREEPSSAKTAHIC